MPRHRRLVTVLALSLLPLAAAGAQRTWHVPVRDRAVTLDLATGFYDEEVTNGFTAAFFPSLRLPIGGGIVAVADLPVSQASVRPGFLGGDRTATWIGNPWLGIEAPLRGNARLEVGIRPGLRDPDNQAEFAAVGFGAITSYDRLEAWLGEVTSVRGMLHFGEVPPLGRFLLARVGASVLVPSGTGGDPEILLNYGLRAGAVTGGTVLAAEITGRALATSESGSVSERTVHQAGISIGGARGRARPEVGVRLFLDSGFRNVQAVLAAGLTVGW